MLDRRLFISTALVLTFCAGAALGAVPAAERAALVDLYDSTGGAGWNDSDGWLGAVGTECAWAGVTCNDEETAVVALSFNSNHLVGSIPSTISSFTALRSLDLSYNELTGAIPSSIGNLSNLEELSLGNNQLSEAIPSSLGNLSHLVYLALQVNELTGAIPQSIGNLANLTELDLYENRLTGAIPTQLGQLVAVRVVTLGYNQLTGAIPGTLGGLVSVEVLDLAANQLTGSMPSTLGNLTNLTVLDVSENQLTGSLPDALAGLVSLRKLVVYDNHLTGSVPAWLGDLADLEEILAASNGFSGSIPPNLGSLPALRTLNFESNQLTGTIPPTLGSLDDLEYLALGFNQLSGAIPVELASLPRLVALSLYSNRLTGSIPPELGDASSLAELGLGGNMLSGTIPPELGGLSNLDTLSLENNALTGTIPEAIGDLTNLVYLDLAGNQIAGPIPAALADLGKLRSFLVYGNQLTGAVPTWLADLPDLEEILVGGNRLTGTIPTNLTTLTKLTYLDVCGNSLSGPIPADIGNLVNLQYLELCSNDLSGPIPAGLWTLANLVDVRLDDNQFTGALPPEVGNLATAELLLLGYNHLEGAIPPEISGLVSMTILELDGNRFTGTIPPELGELTTLEFLGLSDNDLGGAIPASLANLVNLEDGLGLRLGHNALYTASSSLRAFLDQKHDPEDPWESTQTIAPTGLSISSVTDRSFVAHLTPIEYVYDEGGYEITVTLASSGATAAVATTPSKESDSIVVRGLSPSTSYRVTARSVTHPHGYQQNLVRSEATAPVTVTTGTKVTAPASVDVTVPPAGLVEIGGVPQGDTSYTLTNFGDVATTIIVEQWDTFFTQSPTTFVLGPGSSQVVTVSAVPGQAPDSYWGSAVPTGNGVPEDLSVTIQLLSVAAPSGTVVAEPLSSRVDVAGAPGTDTIGTVSFRNTGTATLVGILVSDVEWIETPADLVEIPPDEIRNVNFTVRRSKRPDAGLAEGALSTTLRLVYLDGGSHASIANLRASAATTGVTQTLVTVVDTSKPTVASGTISPPGSGDILRIVPGVPGGSSRLSDLLITNAFGSAAVSDLRVFFRETGSTAAQVAVLSGLAPTQALALSGVVGSVFGASGDGSLVVSTTSPTAIGVSARMVDPGSAAGSFSATLPVFRSDRATAPGDEIDLAGTDVSSFSSTIFVQEMAGGVASASIDAYDASGAALGSPIDIEQLGPFELASVASLPAGTKSVVVRNPDESNGSIIAYARMEDETSGDLWTIVDWRRAAGLDATQSMRVPFVLREAESTSRRRPVRRPSGNGKAAPEPVHESAAAPLRTNVAIFNPSGGPVRVDLTYRDSSGERRRSMTLATMETATFSDVASTMLGYGGASTGSLEIDSSGGVVVSARVHGVATGGGSLGAAIPLVAASAGLRVGQSRVFPGLDDVRQATFDARIAGASRTSFGFTETAGASATVRVSALVFDGRALAGTAVSKTFTVDPYETVVMDGMLRSIVGATRETLFGDLRNLQLEVQVTGGDGAVVPFVIETDSGSGDMRFRLE